MNDRRFELVLLVLMVFLLTGVFFLPSDISPAKPEEVWAAEFERLSKNGNSSCSRVFKNAIDTMPSTARLQGSCCSLMDIHRYAEQMQGLKKYEDIPEIPLNPYDIEASLAQKLQAYYDVELTPDEKEAYDYAFNTQWKKAHVVAYVGGGTCMAVLQRSSYTNATLRVNRLSKSGIFLTGVAVVAYIIINTVQ